MFKLDREGWSANDNLFRTPDSSEPKSPSESLPAPEYRPVVPEIGYWELPHPLFRLKHKLAWAPRRIYQNRVGYGVASLVAIAALGGLLATCSNR